MIKHRFIIPGSIPGKARPRVTKNGTYMPTAYRNFKLGAIEYLPIVDKPLKYPLSIKVNLIGSHRSDLDNIVGTILDILVDQGIIENDSSRQVPDVHITRFESKEKFADITIAEISGFSWNDYLKSIKIAGLHICNMVEKYLQKTSVFSKNRK